MNYITGYCSRLKAENISPPVGGSKNKWVTQMDMRRQMKNHGFTLVEVLVAMFTFALLAALVAGFAVYYLQSYNFSFVENQQIGVAQYGLTTIIREIREARLADNGAYAIEQAEDTNFIFFADVTNDGRSDRIRYFLNGTELQKGVTEPTAVPVTYPSANEQIKTMVADVDTAGAPIFTYYNGEWPADTINNPLAAGMRLLNTRYVMVALRINIQSGTGVQPFNLSSGVNIRSLKNNL